MRTGCFALLSILLFHGCGGKTNAETTLCDPGATLTCPPPCPGVSTCATDGSAWSSCCGSAGAGYGGSGGVVGAGGAGSGGVVGGSGGSGGVAGGVMCASKYCGDYQLAGFVMPGCCSAPNQCAASIDPVVSEALTLPSACIDIEQSGNNDPSCPSQSYVDPVDGQKKEYPGCCRSEGTCGLKVDFVLELGPYFGCIDAGVASGQVCGSPSCLDCIQSQCQDALQACLVESPTCSAIASCSLGCEDKACVDACVQQNPGDLDVFDQLVECATANCPIACAALTG